MVYQELHGALVVIRPLQRRYFKEYITALSPQIRARLHIHDAVCEMSYLHSALTRVHGGHAFFYCIFDRRTDQLIGAIELRDARNGHGQLYSWVNERYWGMGHFREALSRVSRVYFESTGASSLQARVDISNRRSYHALTKSGFAQAGIVVGPRGKQYELILRRK